MMFKSEEEMKHFLSFNILMIIRDELDVDKKDLLFEILNWKGGVKTSWSLQN